MTRRAKLMLLMLLALCGTAPSLFAQNDTSQQVSEDTPGFGLQASIFTNVQNTSVDLSRSFSDAQQYVMTPGDVFSLTMSYGVSVSLTEQTSSVQYRLQLSEDYTLDVPVLGNVSVEGYNLISLRAYVSSSLKAVLPLQHVSLVLAQPAQFNVFVYGNVNRPGFLTATPMLRVIDAIALSGGFKPDGSYRRIRLERRRGNRILDISRFYSDADFGANPVLQPGDVLFVPVAPRIATIQGEIRYPGRYELVEGETIDTVLRLAGGLLPAADSESIDLVRQNERNAPMTIRVSSGDYDAVPIENGDLIRVRSNADNLLRVAIEGAIWGRRVSATDSVSVPTVPIRMDLPFYESMSLLDVLEEVGGPTPFADASESFILRERPDNRMPVDIHYLWQTRNEDTDLQLQPGDTVIVPIQTLDVFVTGLVASPGKVPYTAGHTVNDYILLAGGLDRRRASTDALFLIDDSGRRTPVDRHDVVPRGSTIFVGRKMLFFVDDTVQNVLLGAAWVTSTITVITTVIQFIDLVFPGFIP